MHAIQVGQSAKIFQISKTTWPFPCNTDVVIQNNKVMKSSFLTLASIVQNHNCAAKLVSWSYRIVLCYKIFVKIDKSDHGHTQNKITLLFKVCCLVVDAVDINKTFSKHHSKIRNDIFQTSFKNTKWLQHLTDQCWLLCWYNGTQGSRLAI